jgi:hypothetical protein
MTDPVASEGPSGENTLKAYPKTGMETFGRMRWLGRETGHSALTGHSAVTVFSVVLGYTGLHFARRVSYSGCL